MSMKHQEVSVDYWAMLKGMCIYGVLTACGWLMLRLFNTAFMLPRRLRAHQETLQDTLEELKRRFPDLNFTEEDLINAEKELEELTKEDKSNTDNSDKLEKQEDINTDTPQIEEKEKNV